METQTERMVQDDEGVSQPAAETEVQPSIDELAAAATTEDRPEGDGPSVEGEQQLQPSGPPAGYEGVPPELWPDADGKPPQLTERLLKTLRAKYFTVRHPLLTECGHKLDMINQPKNNCENCWFQWFNTHPQLVEVADQFYRTHGKNAMIGMRGKKFVKNFGRYMVTVIHLMKEEGRLPSEPSNPEGSNASSVDGGAEVGTLEGGTASQATDQGREVESRGIGSGLTEYPVRNEVSPEVG